MLRIRVRPAGGLPPADHLLLGAGRRSMPWLAAAVAARGLDVALRLAEPYLLARVVDTLVRGADCSAWLAALSGLFALDLVVGALDVGVGLFLVTGTAAWLRRRLIERVLALGPAGRHRHAPGDLVSRLMVDVEATAAAAPTALGALAEAGVALGGVVALGFIDFRLVAVFSLGAGFAVLAMRAPISEINEGFLRYSRTLGEIADRLVNALRGVTTIRAARTVEQERDRVLAPLAELSACGHRIWRGQRGVGLRLGIAAPATRIAVLSVAGFGVSAGRLGPGEFLAAVGYLEMAMGVLDIPQHLVGIAEARADAARVAEVLCAERITPPTGAVLPPGPGQLAFRDLTVRHDRGHSPLDGVDLTVRAGSMVALVGDENSGKSTLAAAAAGLIVPDGGTALLDGTSVAALDATVARAAVGYAPQRPSLVGATVGEAIALGVVDPIDIGPATRTACIAEFVDRLPHGPRTPLTEVTMSGGELQRLGIARALAGGARLIVLDDATSSLDTVTESLLYTALQDRSVRRTVLTVTHRPATAARADLVAWLENGRLRAVARHADLWRDPAYRAVFGVADEGDTAAEIAGELVAVGAIR